jgi:hypothetical protein
MSQRARRLALLFASGAIVFACWSLRGAARPSEPRPDRSERDGDDATSPRGRGEHARRAVADRDDRSQPLAGVEGELQERWESDPEPPLPRRRDPHWLVKFFTPQAGESLFDYRDRVLPVVQAAAAPQRARVRRSLDEFAQEAALSSSQRQTLHTAVRDAADGIQDRVMQAVLSGEVLPPRLKPSVGVALARDLLDEMDRANRRFNDCLSQDQRDRLAESRFDVVDYLVFSTRWEDMLGVTAE